MGPIYQYGAIVRYVHDGDTYICDIDMGLRIWTHKKSIRIRDFDTAELNSKNPLEVKHAQEARDFMLMQLPEGTKIVLVTTETAVYDRWQAHVWYQLKGVWVSARDQLVAGGFAKRSVY